MKTSSTIKLVLLVILIAAAVYFFRFTATGRSITPQVMLEAIHQYQPYDRLVYVLVYIVGTVLLLPGTVLSFAGAVLFGTLQGTLLTWIGATIGSMITFWIAKLLGRDFVQQIVGGKMQKLDDIIGRNGFWGVLVVRLLPIFPFNGVNFGSGLTSIRFVDYASATAIGILPWTFIYQYLFATVGQKILTEGFHWSYLWDPNLLLPVGLFLAATVVVKVVLSRWGKPGEEVGPKPTVE